MRADITFMLMALLVALPFPSLASGAPPDQAPTVISVSIRLDQETQEAVVTEQTSASVTFTGQVAVDKLPAQRAVVTLTSGVDTGWVSSISPTTAVFTSNTPQEFTVTVVVPEKSPSAIVGRLLVHAAMSSGSLTAEASDNATLTVKQYFQFQMKSDAPYFEAAKPGVLTVFRLMIENKGNGPDSFALQISNLPDLRSKGWTARLDREVTPVVQGGLEVESTVTVTPPDSGPILEGRPTAIIVKAGSEGARVHNQTISLSFPLYYYQKALDPVFDLTVPIVIVAVVVAFVAVGVWRWRRKRKGRVLDVEEVPPE
jgi:hypothetical protein